MKNAIEIKKLKKSYKDFQLKNINLEIPAGTIVGLIGKNGAGKTTLLKCLLNMISIEEGTIKIFGQEYKQKERMIKEEIGIVLDNMFFPEILTVADIDKSMKHIYKNWDSKLFYQQLKDFDIKTNQKLKELSKGMRKKLEIATTFSHHPKLLILDEPTSGLDPIIRNELLDLFLKFIEDPNHTILLSTHITSDLEHIADKIVFIDQGKIVMDESRDDILDRYAILKCDPNYFEQIDKADIVAYQKNKYDYHILISDIDACRKKYPDCIFDQITLEDLMMLMIKGEK